MSLLQKRVGGPTGFRYFSRSPVPLSMVLPACEPNFRKHTHNICSATSLTFSKLKAYLPIFPQNLPVPPSQISTQKLTMNKKHPSFQHTSLSQNAPSRTSAKRAKQNTPQSPALDAQTDRQTDGRTDAVGPAARGRVVRGHVCAPGGAGGGSGAAAAARGIKGCAVSSVGTGLLSDSYTAAPLHRQDRHHRQHEAALRSPARRVRRRHLR